MIFRCKRLSCLCCFLAGLSMLFLCSCDSGSKAESTGSISFNLEWKSGAIALSDVNLTAAGDVCSDYQISTVNAAIFDSADTRVATRSFNCSQHSGSFADIPAGSGYRLEIQGMVSGNPDWSGQANGLSVTDGQTTDAGKISMTYNGSDTTAPTVDEIYPNAVTVGVPLKPAVRVEFTEPMAASSITVSSFSLMKAGDSSTVSGKITYDAPSMTATFTPDADLEPSTTYVATLNTDIQDIAGNSFDGDLATEVAENFAWTFNTGAFLPGCTYTLTPSSLSIIFFRPSITRTVSVDASDDTCTWTATSSAPSWLSITSGNSGTGDGTVAYQISENTTGSARTATLTIADKTITIEQKATSLPVLIWDAGKWDEVVWQ